MSTNRKKKIQHPVNNRGQVLRLFLVIFLVIMAILLALVYTKVFSWEGRASEGLLVLQDIANFKKAYLQVLGSPSDNISICYKMRIRKECVAAIVKEHPIFSIRSGTHDIAAATDLPVLAYGGQVVLPEFDNCGATPLVPLLPYDTVAGDTTCPYQCQMWFRISKERVKEVGEYKTKMKVLQHNGDGCN